MNIMAAIGPSLKVSVDVENSLEFHQHINDAITTSIELHKTINKIKERIRKFSMEDHAKFIIFNRGSGLTTELGNYMGEHKIDLGSISKQAFSKGREKLGAEVFISMNTQFLDNIGYYTSLNDFKTFKDYNVIAIDGSEFEIPDHIRTREEFNVTTTEKRKNPAMATFSAAYDVCNSFILHGVIGDCNDSELKLADMHIEYLKDKIDFSKTIFVFDRFYASTELYLKILRLGGNFVVRMRDNAYKKEQKSATEKDNEISFGLNSSRLKTTKFEEIKDLTNNNGELDLRIARFEIPKVEDPEKFTEEIILTNIPENSLNADDICEIYNLRWQIEISYNALKNKLHIENYTGIRRFVVEQDIYSKFILYNVSKYMQNHLTDIINEYKYEQGYNNIYKANESNVMGRVITDVCKMLNNPVVSNIVRLVNNIVRWGIKDYNIVLKGRHVPRPDSKQRKFNHNHKKAR